MKNRKLEELCSSINYDTFKKIGLTEIGIYGLGLAVRILEGNTQLQLFSLPITVIGNLSMTLFCLQELLSLKSYSKEVTEIKNIQDDIIRKFALLIKDFGFKDPSQAYASYVYALYNGYLSYNKSFSYSKDNIIDESRVLSASISSGTGICRHISPFLDKVLKQLNYEAYILIAYCREADIKCNVILPNENTHLDSVEQFLIDACTRTTDPQTLEALERAMKIFGLEDYTLKYNYKYKNADSMVARMHGNHVLNYVIYNNQSYFLDSTQVSTYSITPDKKRLVDNNGYEIIIKKFNFNNQNSKEFRKAFKNIPKSIDERELQTLISTAENMCSQNQDIFEKFYLENCDNYERVTSLIRKLKK